MVATLRALFRCDASPTIGGGHLSRCLALAEALLAAGWRVGFATGPDTAAMTPSIAADCFLLELSGGAEDESAAMRVHYPDGVDLLVVDHYQRDVHFEAACRGWARQILVMDDATGRRHDCDLLVDASARVQSAYRGRVSATTDLLLGPAYALVRRGFIARRREALNRRTSKPVRDILVSFGATDPLNVTPLVLDVLESYGERISVTIGLSSHAPHLDEVRSKLRSRMRLVLDGEMPLLMSEADLAIGAAGASAYERAVLGLPSVAIIAAANQRNLAHLLRSAGASVIIDVISSGLRSDLETSVRFLMDSDEKRSQMAQAGANLIDGRAAERVARFIATKVECV
jgi:UDP-2,4-diacetamido-2,4,6-trideoxy-beta-L-altropyranose hydrolase